MTILVGPGVGGLRVGEERANVRPNTVGTDQQISGDDPPAGELDFVATCDSPDLADGHGLCSPHESASGGFARRIFARNLDELRALVQGLTRKGVRVEFVKENLVFTGENFPIASQPHALVICAFTKFERSLIRERQWTVSRSFTFPSCPRELCNDFGPGVVSTARSSLEVILNCLLRTTA